MTNANQTQLRLGGRCNICRELLVDEACPNTVCRLPDQEFSRIYTVSESAEEMWQLIYRYKYGEERHLADYLGRTLATFLEDNRDELQRFDLFTTAALYIGPQAQRLWDYLELIVEAAQQVDQRWPFATDLITKVRPTGRFLGIGVPDRRAIAEGELRDALLVPDPTRVAGKRVLVIDDVYSEGYTLREMARTLRLEGAAEVAGLVFARRKGA